MPNQRGRSVLSNRPDSPIQCSNRVARVMLYIDVEDASFKIAGNSSPLTPTPPKPHQLAKISKLVLLETRQNKHLFV